MFNYPKHVSVRSMKDKLWRIDISYHTSSTDKGKNQYSITWESSGYQAKKITTYPTLWHASIAAFALGFLSTYYSNTKIDFKTSMEQLDKNLLIFLSKIKEGDEDIIETTYRALYSSSMGIPSVITVKKGTLINYLKDITHNQLSLPTINSEKTNTVEISSKEEVQEVINKFKNMTLSQIINSYLLLEQENQILKGFISDINKTVKGLKLPH
jgi:hypothetical protein